jgi:roadblock/LC7 domain-containing protein
VEVKVKIGQSGGQSPIKKIFHMYIVVHERRRKTMKKRSIFMSLVLMFLFVVVLTACKKEPDDPHVEPITFSVSLNIASRTIVQGNSFILVATLDGITEYDSVGWAQDGDLLQVSPNGLNAVVVAGEETGIETITVTVIKDDVQESASAVITIEPIILNLSVDDESVVLNQGESADVVVTITPVNAQTVVTWSVADNLVTLESEGHTATLIAGANVGTTTVTVTATIFGQIFSKDIDVTVNEIMPYVNILSGVVDVNLGTDIEIPLDFVQAYQSNVSWNISVSEVGLVDAVVTTENTLVVSGLQEGQTTLTLTMTTNGVSYEDTIEIFVRPEGFLSVSGNTYDLFELQLNFTESTFFSSIDEEIWQQYNILLGSASNSGQGDLRGQFIFAMNHMFAQDEGKDVIQVMANGMSAMAIRIPDSIDDIAAFEISMKLATLEETFAGTWRLEFFIATVLDGKTILYGRKNDDNNAIVLGNLTISNEELKREGYQTYRFNINEIPENAGNYIVIYFGNTNSFNGTEENRTYIESFNFLPREQVGITLTTPPAKLEYVVGQMFDPRQMVVSAVYTAGNNLPISNSNLNFEYDFSNVGNTTVTVTSGEYSITIDVVVIERVINQLVLTTAPNQTVYVQGDLFDPSGMVITANFNDGSSEVVTEYAYDESPLVAGTESILITFEDKSVSVPITVFTAELSSIAVTTLPNQTTYVAGQTANYSGIVVTATFLDESTSVIPFAKLLFSGFDSSTAAANQVITVAYAGLTTTFNIDIIEKVMVGIQIQRYPQVAYFIGQEADWSRLIVVGVFNDNSTVELDFESLTITGYDSSVVGTIMVVIEYLSFDTAFNVVISDDEGYLEVLTANMTFNIEDLVNLNTMFTDLFTGETPKDRSDYDVLLGRTLNDAQRMMQYSTVIYFSGEGVEAVIIVQTNGMSALAVRIPDGLTAEEITAFSFSMSGEHITTLANTITFRPSFRFSSMFDGVEYFHSTDRGDYYLNQSAGMTITHADFTRAGYHDYTVEITQPPLAEGVTIGNYLIMYMGNNGSFRDSTNTSLLINGFKFWTRDVVTDITLKSGPTQTTYDVGEAFNPAGIVVERLYGVNLYHTTSTINLNQLTFDYDFQTEGIKTVTIHYLDFSIEVEVNVVRKALVSLELTSPPIKDVYTAGEVFDPTGVVLTAYYDNETSEVVETYTFDNSPLVLGATFIELSFGELVIQVPITVNSAVLAGIAVTTPPSKVVYVVGQTASFEDVLVTATYADNSTLVVPFEELGFNGFDSSEALLGQVITVSFNEFTATFNIDIIERVSTGISVQTLPKTTYLIDEIADWAELVVVLEFNDDSVEPIDFENLVITGFDSTVEGTITVVVEYLTFDTSFSVTILEDEPQDDGYMEVKTSDMNFNTEGLVNNTTYYTSLFTGENPKDRSDYDVLLGRTVNDAQRMLQYSTAIYFAGEGVEAVIIVQTNGMSALAVRIPDGLTAEEITAFSFSMSGEHITTLADTITFRPTFRFSSMFDGVEYFHTTDRGDYFLNQSAGMTITHGDFTRTGYHDYTVEITQPPLAEGVTMGNYLIMYMGNNGSFRDTTNTSLLINGFKFWTKDVVVDAQMTEQPTQTTYEVGQVFNPEGLVVTPTYDVPLYNIANSVPYNELTFIYDFSVIGETTVTIEYRSYTFQVQVTVVEPVVPEE